MEQADGFLKNRVRQDQTVYSSLEDAVLAFKKLRSKCGGITQTGESAFELRMGTEIQESSSGEYSWIFSKGYKYI